MGYLQLAVAAVSVGYDLYAGYQASRKTTTKTGPKLTDLAVTSSAYGDPIPIATGSVRLATQLIWAEPLQEVATTTKTGGKGSLFGPGKTSETTYTYYGNFAMGICEGVMGSLLRIWFDNKLVYDTSLGAQEQVVPNLVVRYYQGFEDQLPDPLIENVQGVGRTPAHRGLAYLVFDTVLMTNYGNRIPSVTCEISNAAAGAQRVDTFSEPPPGSAGGSPGDLALNTQYGRAYTIAGSGNQTGIREWNTATQQWLQDTPFTDITANGQACPFAGSLQLGKDNLLYCVVSGGDNWPTILQIEPSTMREVGRWCAIGDPRIDVGPFASGDFEGDGFGFFYTYTAIAVPGPIRTDYYLVLGGALSPALGLLLVNGVAIGKLARMRPVWGGTIGAAGFGGVRSLVAGQAVFRGAHALSDFWVLFSQDGGSNRTQLVRVTVDDTASAAPTPNQPAPQDSSQWTYSQVGTTAPGVTWVTFELSPQSLVKDAKAFTGRPGNLVWDRFDNSVTFVASVNTPRGGETYLVKYLDGVGVVWSTLTVGGQNRLQPNNYGTSTPDGVSVSNLNDSQGYQIDAKNGAQLVQQSAAPNGTQGAIFDGPSSSVYSFIGGNLVRIYLGQSVASPVPLADVVSLICTKAGLEAEDYDVSRLAGQTLTGWNVTGAVTAKDALAPLSQIYLFDPVELDDQIAFVPRGAEPQASVSQDKLVRQGGGGPGTGAAEPYVRTRAQEIDLPALVSVTYYDQLRDYQTNTQQAQRNADDDPQADGHGRRIATPKRLLNRSVFSKNELQVSVPAVLDGSVAKQKAEQLLYSYWANRTTYDVQLPPEYLYLAPTDLLTLTLGTGQAIRLRLTTANIGVNYALESKLAQEAPGMYASTAVGARPAVQAQAIGAVGPSELMLLDLPLLRDADDVGPASLVIYWAASAYAEGSWPGVALQQSVSGSQTAYAAIGTDSNSATWGFLETALPDPRSTCRTDLAATVNATVQHGEADFASISQHLFLGGYNALAVFKTDGEVEVIQFRDCQQLAPGRFALSTLLRGRRGTDTMARGHVAGERFVMLRSETLQNFLLDTARRNVPASYRAVTFGTLPEAAIADGFASTGRSLMPYAPVHVAAARSGSASAPDVTLSWVRRTRVGGALQDGTGAVPLSEASEAYQVDVLAGPGGAVLRTLASTSPGATYPNAQIVADFGAVPAKLSVLVYQISAAVGRGFGREDLLEIA